MSITVGGRQVWAGSDVVDVDVGGHPFSPLLLAHVGGEPGAHHRRGVGEKWRQRIRTVWSALAAARWVPSGLNATLATGSVKGRPPPPCCRPPQGHQCGGRRPRRRKTFCRVPLEVAVRRSSDLDVARSVGVVRRLRVSSKVAVCGNTAQLARVDDLLTYSTGSCAAPTTSSIWPTTASRACCPFASTTPERRTLAAPGASLR